MTPDAAPRRAPVGAVGLVALGLVTQEIGASFAVLLFPAVGAVGMVALRLAFSSILLLVIARPSLRGRNRDDWLTVVGFGLVLAAMNVFFYLALERLPLGTTVTIEVLGPLVLSVVTSRRASSWLWAVLAMVGVVLLGRGASGSPDLVGIGFAAAAGAMWALYILLSARTGRNFAKLDGLAIAMTIGAIVVVPIGIVSAGAPIFRPGVLGLGAAVAVLSTAIPYTFELLALRRLPASTFAILMSLGPAIASLIGFLVLHQVLTPIELAGVALVVIASMGAVRFAQRAVPPAVGP